MKFLAFLASLVIRALHATLRVRHVRVEKLESLPQYVLAFWHAHLLLMLHSRWRRPITVMISRSKDGDHMVRVFRHYGAEAARGSSPRGGAAALREMIRAARAGRNIVFTPDGPKGPPRVAKDGVIVAAQATGLPIAPVVFAAKKKSCCVPGTGWSSRCRSRARSISMATRWSCRATATWKSGGFGWKAC